MKKVLIAFLIIMILLQFIRPSLNKGEAFAPTDIANVVQVPDSIMYMLQIACYDCHSNKTTYPWYNMITPVNWWLQSHVDQGKKELNFTSFAQYNFQRKDQLLEAIGETVGTEVMPPESYLWMHSEAKFTAAQRRAIIDWTNMVRQKLTEDSVAIPNKE
jgi:hypothetical protein